MAIWQYTFQLLPGSELTDPSNFHVVVDEEGLFDEEPFWKFTPTNVTVFDDIGQFLTRGASWAESIVLYGDIEGDCVEVSAGDNGLVESAMLRINHSSNYEGLLREIIEFAISMSFVILDEGLNLVPLNFEAVSGVIENSQVKRVYRSLPKTEG